MARAYRSLVFLFVVLPAAHCRAAAAEGPVAGPDAAPRPAALEHRLLAALATKEGDYEPRTEHLTERGGPRFINRLILEDSPYLLQHAHNPVDWFPWSPEAFARAQREGKPIFLSIGYSTCHWCHVMERESFDDVEIAAMLNRDFVAIKVDRERRPDVDEIYMTAVQLTSGRGGWPMSSFLTPTGEPFYGATYFPPDRFTQLLARVQQLWRDRREELEQDATRLADAVARVTAARGSASELAEGVVDDAVDAILSRHDRTRGGFGREPKFPHEPDLLLLIQQSRRNRSPRSREALAAVETTLRAMARGGIYDQVGGGFHRYSTDARWLVPHFEKMLYNQAHLSRAYLAAYAMQGETTYERVVRQTLDYVLREMTSPAGLFYSATDADSEGKEGEFFVWTLEELRRVLGAGDAELAAALFGVTAAGNFEGRSILHLPRPPDEVAVRRQIPLAELYRRLDAIRDRLRAARAERIPPLRDDKVITAWNGMMISALAEAADVLAERRYSAAAERAAERLWELHRQTTMEDGPPALWRVSLEGKGSIDALQEDYAYLAEAFVALYDLAGEERWLERAEQLVDAMVRSFWDDEAGGFFMGGGEPGMIARPKSPGDGAIPSGNSVAARTLIRLAARTGEARHRDRANATLAAFAEAVGRAPAGFSYLLLAADELRNGEAGPREYAADGAVRIDASLEPAGPRWRMLLDVTIDDGWHVNSDQPRQEELVATHLDIGDPSTWRLDDIRFPPSETVGLGFQQEPLSVFRGRVRVAADLVPTSEADAPRDPPVIRLRIQACDDRVCLQPEDVLLELAVGSPPAGL